MRHPALTRVFAAVLAVLCLVMLLAGSLGLVKAAADRQAGIEDIQRLQARIDEYIETDSALSGRKSYEQEKKTLDRKEEKHLENASEHKRELAEYTATKGGLIQGTAALDQADAAMAEGKAQLEAGLREFEAQEAAFNEGYAQYQQGLAQLEQGKQLYAATAAMLASAEAELEKMSALGALIENGDKADMIEQGVAQLDSALSAYDQAADYVNGLAQQGAISAEQLKQFNDAVTAATGMSPEDMRAAAQKTRDDLAAADADEVITDEQLEELKRAYEENREQISAAADAAQAQIAEYKLQLEQLDRQLADAQAELDKLAPMMEQGKQGIELGRAQLEAAKTQLAQGERALYDGRTAIWYQLGKLEDKQAELAREKQALEENRLGLEKSRDAAEEKKALEQRRSSLRLMLLERDGVSRLVDAGAELTDAAYTYVGDRQAELTRDYNGRAAACALMVIGAAAGFAGIPAAFEKSKNRAMLVLPPVLCFVCAAAAEAICLSLGRGSSYSAIGVLIFAAIQLLLVLPRKKA